MLCTGLRTDVKKNIIINRLPTCCRCFQSSQGNRTFFKIYTTLKLTWGTKFTHPHRMSIVAGRGNGIFTFL